ncbi:MAG: tRNA preQ1(34) S-adenosylmethionine ribosyltransferase-isomerase QueA [Gammaproteobacteria bacterium]|nr:tRNA preQ1(34) S-adenosylmethionine ribosyltransferase-isomerase QueA [Gammaproteobacteria bacterium]MBU1926451.1 tRNA preQ1(34) S-adenosylmethionine ribosyltransferase-isomerase QueA [Gammaproteobacteria bacterium]MBU2546381.1 tRNA preQ1(34) S-adenosylmethionine ribosyltransferase-isomerase QueA [Gammaproteobacteria bacterium]
MQTSDFYYELPESLIAQYPALTRSASRLLCLNKNTGAMQHRQFSDLLELISPKDLLVFNNTRVIPARLLGQKTSGGKVEVLVERVLDEHGALTHIRANHPPKTGACLHLEKTVVARVIEKKGDLYQLEFEGDQSIFDLLEQEGHVPLPPYIHRSDEEDDQQRYQTVFAKHKGAVAAPTAGLHFDDAMMQAIASKGVQTAFVTLHVGAGTFLPVRVEDVTKHQMHSEWVDVSEDVCDAVAKTRARGGRVIAVGTTTVRSLESASSSGQIEPFRGDTDIFIYPGYEFKTVDAMVTNFHLPESTLMMLISAFSDRETILTTYQEAIRKRYRFYSYGDAMFIYE